MMEKQIVLTGMSCESCNILISRIASKSEVRVKTFDPLTGAYWFEYESEEKLKSVLAKLEAMGYSSLGKPSQSRRMSSVAAAFLTGEYPAEREMLVTAIIAFVLSAGLQLALYSFLGMRGQFAKIIPFMLFLDASLSITALALWQFLSVRKSVPCTTGMMVGMTIGMVLGFLAGFSFGATNGMFVGSVIGMALGMALGAWAGSCCGVMGTLEGLMAGLMAGTMGAMLAVMLITDNLLAFAAILLATCIAITGGFAYMIFKEFGAVERVRGHEKVLLYVAMSSLALSAIAMLGPKSVFVFGGG